MDAGPGDRPPCQAEANVMNGSVDAASAAARTDDHFLERHRAFLGLTRERPIDLLFLGDSITRRWAEVPDLWQRHFGGLRAANFGVGGDATQNVIWRIGNGELDGISPKVVVLLIGTNNLPTNSPGEISEAIGTIVRMIRGRLPSTRVLLLAILPRGPQRRPRDADGRSAFYQDGIDEINRSLRRLEDGPGVRFLDFGPKLIGPDGELLASHVPDGLHIVGPGYEAWAEAMGPLLSEMMA
jgi:lysophospholipase L1-like esterase